MAQVKLTTRAEGDLERLFDFLAEKDPVAGRRAVESILDAIDVLQRHPLIGRPAEDGLNELVISRGKSGYVALYRYLPEQDLVRVLAVRHQREAGFGRS